MTWPLSIMVTLLGLALVAGIAWCYQRRLEYMVSRDRANTTYLIAEARAGVEVDAGRELLNMIRIVAAGHSPSCSYCDCKYSATVEGIRKLREAARKREEKLKVELRAELLGEGWTPPDGVEA